MTEEKPKKRSHKAAEALEWDEALSLIQRLYSDGRYRDSMLIACGCYMGLRISDIINLTWNTVCTPDRTAIQEKKTKKIRTMKINPALAEHANRCREALGIQDMDTLIFAGQQHGHRYPITRQRVAQIMKEIQTRYCLKSASTFSSHTLRKTFGRRIWNHEIEQGRNGEFALMLLKDVFHHSDINITVRYLGIRQNEILNVYDNL